MGRDGPRHTSELAVPPALTSSPPTCASCRLNDGNDTKTTTTTTTTALAGKGGTLEPRFFLRVDGVSEDASPPESKAVPRAAHVTSGKRVGSSAREKSITTTAARRAAAPTKQQPRPRSDRMLQDTGLGAGVKCDGGGGGGGGVGGGDGGGSGGGGGGKPAAESRRSEERHETFCPAGGNRSREGHI